MLSGAGCVGFTQPTPKNTEYPNVANGPYNPGQLPAPTGQQQFGEPAAPTVQPPAGEGQERPPLSQAQYTAINQSLRMLSSIREQIARAQAAQVPCDERSQLCQFLQQRLEALKSQYFPHQP